jgi:hypothetical protein
LLLAQLPALLLQRGQLARQNLLLAHHLRGEAGKGEG